MIYEKYFLYDLKPDNFCIKEKKDGVSLYIIDFDEITRDNFTLDNILTIGYHPANLTSY